MTASEAWDRVQELAKIKEPSDKEAAELETLLCELEAAFPESAEQLKQWRGLHSFERALRERTIELQHRPFARFWFMVQSNFAIFLYRLGGLLGSRSPKEPS